MFVLQEGGVKVGEFSLERSVKGAGKFALTVHTRRSGNSGFSQFQHAEMQCQKDTLATPLSWVFETKMAQNPGGPSYLESGRRCSAGVSNGMLAIRNGLRTRRIPIDSPYSNEWTLLEAVNRLPGEETKEIEYTLIDEFDAPHSGHKMSYGDKAQVVLHSGPAEITGYCDLGPAMVPTTYWVDAHHRLLFVCTGLMVYVLSGTNGQAGQFPDRYPPCRPNGSHA